MTVQLVARVSDELVDAIDQLIKEGRFTTRSEAVREGLEVVVDCARRTAIGTAIVDGYLRIPQYDDDASWPDEATRAMIAEEEW